MGSKVSDKTLKDHLALRRVDAAIGRLVAHLEQAGALDRTVIVFTTDNGGTASWKNLPFRGTKRDALEGGERFPTIVHHPASVRANR